MPEEIKTRIKEILVNNPLKKFKIKDLHGEYNKLYKPSSYNTILKWCEILIAETRDRVVPELKGMIICEDYGNVKLIYYSPKEQDK